MMKFAVGQLLVSISITLSIELSEEWWIPTQVEESGDYLCVCSGNAVSEAKMNLKGRGCTIDNTLERHRYMCAYFREFHVSSSCISIICYLRYIPNR